MKQPWCLSSVRFVLMGHLTQFRMTCERLFQRIRWWRGSRETHPLSGKRLPVGSPNMERSEKSAMWPAFVLSWVYPSLLPPSSADIIGSSFFTLPTRTNYEWLFREFQAFGIRWEMLRHPAAWTEQSLDSVFQAFRLPFSCPALNYNGTGSQEPSGHKWLCLRWSIIWTVQVGIISPIQFKTQENKQTIFFKKKGQLWACTA